jgi:hypothetical protein
MRDCGLLRKRRRLVLLVLVEVERLLDLVAEALAIRRLGVSSVLLLVHVASTAATCVELILSFACRKLRYNIGGATRSGVLRSKARRFAYVPSTSTTGRELVEGRCLALRAFARDCPVCVDSVVNTDITGAWGGSVVELS